MCINMQHKLHLTFYSFWIREFKTKSYGHTVILLFARQYPTIHLSDNLTDKIHQPFSRNPVIMRRRFMHASAVLFLPRKERPPIIIYICPVMLELLVRSDHLLPVNLKYKNAINEINENSTPEKKRV